MKKIILTGLVFVSACLSSSFGLTTFNECYQVVGNLWIAPADAKTQKIAEYEAKLKADPKDYYAGLAIGILYDSLAANDAGKNLDIAKKGIHYTDLFLKSDSGNPLGLIYNGLGHSFIGRDSNNPIEKMLEVNKASELCDKAVKNAEGKDYEWNIRFLRGNFYGSLPDFFKKADTAEKDFQFLINTYSSNTNIIGVIPTAYFYMGEMQKTRGNLDAAIENWKKAVDIGTKVNQTNTYEVITSKKRIETFAD